MDSQRLGDSANHDNLTSVLEDCTQVASSWYSKAAILTEETNTLLSKANEKAKQNISNLEHSPVRMPNTLSLLKTNLRKIQDIIAIENGIERDLEIHRQNMSRFSITLFGRTMAGKSTLMEILTHGNGQSIGQGAQRTTRDVRHYIWNHLDITDVPGIAAVDGQEDAEIAFCEAKKADMILFLLTDDGPQESEAEWFSQLIKLGKPILCAINVKAPMPDGKSVRFIEKQIQKRFDMERLESLKNQFLEFASRYEQSWKNIPFVYVHLRSAFVAQHTDDPNIASNYQQLSRINDLTEHIIEIVQTKGRFYRMKNFADIISKPMIDALDILYGFARECCKSYLKIDRAIAKVKDWRDNTFIQDSATKIGTICQIIRSEFELEIPTFADEHYEDSKAESEWHKVCIDIYSRHEHDIFALPESAYQAMIQFSENIITPEEFSSELPSSTFDTLKLNRITETKERFRKAFSTLATLAIPAAWIGGPVVGGVVAIGAGISGITSLFLDSKDKKVQKRKKEIETTLNTHINEICANLERDLNHFLKETVVPKIIDSTLEKMLAIRERQSVLYRDLLQLASNLNKKLCLLNLDIVKEAFVHCGLPAMNNDIHDIARIPGKTVLILLKDELTNLNIDEVRSLMTEDIQIAHRHNNMTKTELIANILGIDNDRIRLMDDAARVSPSSETIETARLLLAQQISDVPIWILRNSATTTNQSNHNTVTPISQETATDVKD